MVSSVAKLAYTKQYREKNKEKARAYGLQWYKNNKDKPEYRAKKRQQKIRYDLWSKYGLTEEQYFTLFNNQNGCCAICDKHQDEFTIRLAVDHSSFTGEIRGLLCTYCNHTLVGRRKDGDELRKAADYIENGTGLFVPKETEGF